MEFSSGLFTSYELSCWGEDCAGGGSEVELWMGEQNNINLEEEASASKEGRDRLASKITNLIIFEHLCARMRLGELPNATNRVSFTLLQMLLKVCGGGALHSVIVLGLGVQHMKSWREKTV